ncbi:sensor domain-containing diguanylate cyclase [Isoptericola sp. b490]|uniref:sensor domain-containing diguanylate cyclase n=1 Tax=Actinotalea lenta TaxID=3064654 RepID=UPI002714091E|nr:sensor domain-containing diguanylate cyclase [Isoptericola sp. b490]MDO8122067.1 sensor domain-containing diguanylate cyclase [Isoptericola sp. b490]
MPGAVAIATAVLSGAVALPAYSWLHTDGLVSGAPWELALMTPLVVLAGLEPVQRWIGSGRLDNRPAVRLTLAYALFAAYTWLAGWSLVLPATAILVAVVHIQRSGSQVWRPAVLLLAVTTALGQIGVATGAVSTVVAPAVSHVATLAIFLLSASGVLSVGLAVSERQHVEAALARADARLRALMESSSDVLTVSDARRRLTYVSPAVERVLGQSQQDLLGADLLTMVDPGHRDHVAAELADVVTAGRGTRTSFDVVVTSSGGDARWYEWTVHNLLGDRLVEGLVIEQRDVTERLQHQEELRFAAAHDDLTGLPNRTGLLERLGEDLAMAETEAGVAVLFLDLDRFKEVNDTHGHAAGDEVLVALAKRLRAGLRPHDHLARISGDEFCAILTDVHDVAEVAGVVGRLAQTCDVPVALRDGTQVSVGASIGVSLAFSPDREPDAMLAQADDDMYADKRARRWREENEARLGLGRQNAEATAEGGPA